MKGKWWIVLGFGLVVLFAFRVGNGAMISPFDRDGIFVWVAAFLTLAIMSFLYMDNPIYRFAEHLFIGVSAAYAMVMGLWTTLIPNGFAKVWPSLLTEVLPGLEQNVAEYRYLIPLTFGILLLCRLSAKVGFLSKWSLGFVVGIAAGLNFVRYLVSDFLLQINGTILPLLVFDDGSFKLGASLSNTIMVAGVLASLIYFFFSKEHKGIFGYGSRVGILVLMISFGAAFGYTVMGRVALLVGRFEFLLGDWLKIVQQ